MDFLSTAQGVIALITGLVGLISAGIGAYFAIKNFIANMKGKSFNEIWKLIMEMADAGMVEAEKSGKSGEDKKKIVIDSVSASCAAAGIDIGLFASQLNTYIDQTITFVNNMKK